MKTFYSIVYAVITPETGEKIALGVLLSNGVISRFRFSWQKLEGLKHFIGDKEHDSIRAYIKSVEKMANHTEPIVSNIIAMADTGQLSMVSESYISYLSTYSQNMVSFGKPIQIDLSVEDENLDNLFNALINEKELSSRHQVRHQIHLIKEKFISSVDRFFTAEFEITPESYTTLTFPVKLDLLGKNEIPVFASFLDFEKAMHHIKSDFFDIEQVIHALKVVKGFVVSSEPDKGLFKNQHIAWDRFRNKPDIEYLDLSEVEKIRDYAMAHEVAPWLA